MKSVLWSTCQRLSCSNSPSPTVIICLTDTGIVKPPNCIDDTPETVEPTTIEATLTKSWRDGLSGCNPVYRYLFQYDETNLIDPVTPLTTAEISGVFCKGCLTSWIEEEVGNEITLINNNDGTYTLTSQHGCQYTIDVGSNCCCWSTVLIASYTNTNIGVLSDVIYRRGDETWDPYTWSTNVPIVGPTYGSIPAIVGHQGNFPYDVSAAFSPAADKFYTFTNGEDSIDGQLNVCDTSDIANPTPSYAVSVDYSGLASFEAFLGNSLACDPTTGILYFLYLSGGGGVSIATLDPVTGLATNLNDLEIIVAYAFLWFDTGGQLYIGYDFGGVTAIDRLDKSDGSNQGTSFAMDPPCAWDCGYDGNARYAFLKVALNANLKFLSDGTPSGSDTSGIQGEFYIGDQRPIVTTTFVRYFCESDDVVTFTDRDIVTGDELSAWPEGTTFVPPDYEGIGG